MRYPVTLRRVLPAILLLAPVLAAARASAAPLPHLALKRSEPADQSRLTEPPAFVALWFTARPQLAFSRIRLSGPMGEISLDTLVADTGNVLRARIPRTLSPGEYRVSWQTASADGHPIRGEFTFTVLPSASSVGDPAAQPASPDTTVRAPRDVAPAVLVDPSRRSDYRSARWVEFVALITIFGTLGFRHGVLPPLASRGVPTADAADRARRLGMGGLFLYGLAALVRLYTESLALNGPGRALAPDTLLPVLTQTTWGMGWITGAVGALLLFAGWAISRRTVALGTPLALTGALGMAVSPALTGHAASSSSFVLAVTLDVMHVLAAGVWLGGLLMVVLAGIPAMKRLTDGNPDAAVSALVNSFHPIALLCAPVVVMAGLGTSALRLGGLAPLTTTAYGRTLMIKVLLFLLVAGAALYNSMRGRRLLGTPAATSGFRRSAVLELALAALVLAATAYLVTVPVPSLMVSQ